jgi:hypothetical protein
MASLFNRLRPRSREQEVVPPHTNATGIDTSDTSNHRADSEKDDPTTADPPKSHDAEKLPHDVTTSGESPVGEEEDEADLPEDVRVLPKIVRSIVSLEDDPNAATVTFRYFLLCFIFVPPGAVLFQMGIFRTTASAYPVLFVQIGMINVHVKLCYAH